MSETPSPKTDPALPRVFVVGDGGRAAVADAAPRLLRLLGDRVELVGCDLERAQDLRGLDVDLVVVLGGDGAILAAARRLHDSPAPVLGVNFGKLGFLAALRASELESRAEEVVVRGRYRVSRRMTLEAHLHRKDGRVEAPVRGLNDAVVERWDARSLSVDFEVDGRPATTYRGDGVIVATPTGSTAHSLAAGGPLVEPGVEAFVVSPICAHSVTNRPLVLAPDQEIVLRVGPGSARPGLAVDGQVLFDLSLGDEVVIRRAEAPVLLAAPRDRTFFDVLRLRLQWAGQPPYDRS